MLTIYLIRHGEKNKDGSALTKDGIQQVHHLANRLKGIKFRKIYSSVLPRCLQTAEIISRHHPNKIIYEKGLREVGGRVKEYPKRHKKEISAIRTVYKKLKKEKGNILVVSSGIVNRILLSMFLKIEPNKAHFVQNPTGLNLIQENIKKKRFRILHINEISHLPGKLRIRKN